MGMNYFWSQKRQRPQNYRRQSANRLSLQISKWYPQLSLAPPSFLCIPASRSLAREATTPIMGSIYGFCHNTAGISTAPFWRIIKAQIWFPSVILVSRRKQKCRKPFFYQASGQNVPYSNSSADSLNWLFFPHSTSVYYPYSSKIAIVFMPIKIFRVKIDP